MESEKRLIELLYEAEEKCEHTDCGQCEHLGLDACGFRVIANHLIANGVTVQEWISVKDRLPEKKGTFLVCTKNDFYCTKNIAKVRFYNGEWHGTGGVWSNVTHWMPLPPLPKGE